MKPAEQTTDPHMLRDVSARLEKDLLQQAMALHNGNITRAADDLGLSRQTFYDLLINTDWGRAKGEPHIRSIQ